MSWRREPRDDFNHRSQGSAWAGESTSNGKDWKSGRGKAEERRTSDRRRR